eukprot:TRINITY_DN48510_c0_g1_i2.p1 TRINITY_DN48510_c0_g1~~TRINITY_DN48510_c0_g1_i2.p1  ORF type:complete len:197 (+),score=39.45 TRINITY_DN48510_c0_g1_i2:320-910(+)
MILCAPEPRQAFNLAHQYEHTALPGWLERKNEVMYSALIAKFTQHPALADLLLSTGDAYIVEDSPIDFYWGCGADGSGSNWLGKTLMAVRKFLQEGGGTDPNPPTTTTTTTTTTTSTSTEQSASNSEPVETTEDHQGREDPESDATEGTPTEQIQPKNNVEPDDGATERETQSKPNNQPLDHQEEQADSVLQPPTH